MKKLFVTLWIMLLLALLYINVGLAQQNTVTMPYEANPQVIVDGLIGAGEYKASYLEQTTNIMVNWEHNGTFMFVALQSPGTGWVGIGFGPTGTGMDGANIFTGYFEALTENVVIVDEFGQGFDHPSDISLGGSDNIISKAGSESAGKTTIEFVFPLTTTDTYDFNLALGGTYGFFLGFHQSNDDVTSYHTERSDTIDLFLESPKLPPIVNFTYMVNGLTVNFTQTATAQVGSITSWLWNFGDGTSSVQPNPIHTFPTMDNYVVSLTATDSRGENATKSENIIVPSKPERLSIWSTQVVFVSIIIALISFFAVGIIAGRKQKGGK